MRGNDTQRQFWAAIASAIDRGCHEDIRGTRADVLASLSPHLSLHGALPSEHAWRDALRLAAATSPLVELRKGRPQIVVIRLSLAAAENVEIATACLRGEAAAKSAEPDLLGDSQRVDAPKMSSTGRVAEIGTHARTPGGVGSLSSLFATAERGGPRIGQAARLFAAHCRDIDCWGSEADIAERLLRAERDPRRTAGILSPAQQRKQQRAPYTRAERDGIRAGVLWLATHGLIARDGDRWHLPAYATEAAERVLVDSDAQDAAAAIIEPPMSARPDVAEPRRGGRSQAACDVVTIANRRRVFLGTAVDVDVLDDAIREHDAIAARLGLPELCPEFCLSLSSEAWRAEVERWAQQRPRCLTAYATSVVRRRTGVLRRQLDGAEARAVTPSGPARRTRAA